MRNDAREEKTKTKKTAEFSRTLPCSRDLERRCYRASIALPSIARA